MRQLMKSWSRVCFLFIGSCILSNIIALAENKMGVLILASSQGDVRFETSDGKPGTLVKAGEAIPSDYYVVTGFDGKVIGLLSNGTLLTLGENSRMKVATFEQEAFDDKEQKMSELSEEPSKSKVILDLDSGSLILKTKKLNKDSSLKINSPLGFAGIRGTEFQMASSPGQGVQLDVTESTVEFTAPGGSSPIAVSEGSGLSAPPGSAPTLRPVNPSVALKIQVSNQVASEATQDVSLGEVSAVIEQVESTGGSETESDASSEAESSDSGDESTEEAEAAPLEVPEGSPLELGDPQASALENNAEIAQARKTGKFDPQTKELAKFGLMEEQTLRFYQLSPRARTMLLNEERLIVRRLLSLEGFNFERADAFFEYRRNTRFLILELEDEVMLTLLDQGIEEVLLEESLTKLNLDFSKSNRVPNLSQFSGIDERAKSLSESLMQSENGEVIEKLGEMANGEWTDELLRIGEVADSLMRDYQIDENLLIETLDVSEVMSNPFYAEVSALYDQLQLDGLIQGGGQVIGGRHLIVTGNARILANSFLNEPGDLVVSASHSLSLPEDLEWNPTTTTDSRLVAMSAGDLTLNQGVSFKSATSDLLLAARNNLLLHQVSLNAAREVAVRGLKDVSLNDVSIGADLLITIKARRDLDVDGLIFKRNVSQILMEATTMRLRNVDFPLSSQVRLNSLHGPIDGKYPNFGTSIPAAQQIGRVNFIENVRSGGNLMNDRPSFDLHGKNIEIGKIARP
jgi:hypothetical protein